LDVLHFPFLASDGLCTLREAIIGAGAAGSTVRGLRVGGFANNGIVLTATTQVTVAGQATPAALD
jgi:hypothetical protein